MTYLVLVNMGLNKQETYETHEIIGFFRFFVFKYDHTYSGAAWTTTQNIGKTKHTTNSNDAFVTHRN